MVSLILVAAIVALLIQETWACSCLSSTFERQYFSSLARGTPISVAKVLSSSTRRRNPVGPFPSIDAEIVYKLRVKYVFANCAPRHSYIAYAVTADNSGLCGVRLTVGSEYLLQLKVGAGKESDISLCGVNILLQSVNPSTSSRLTSKSRRFLLTRRFCCRGRCRCANRAAPSFRYCLATSCKYAKKPCAEATKCVTNRCDSCNAEWFNKAGHPACETRIGENAALAPPDVA